jgi:hypothetical protein
VPAAGKMEPAGVDYYNFPSWYVSALVVLWLLEAPLFMLGRA